MLKKRRTLRTQAIAKKRRRIFLLKGVLLVVFLVLCVIGLGYLLTLQSLLITEVRVEGTKSSLEEEIQTQVEATLQGEYYALFPKKNIYYFPKKRIQSAILAHHKLLAVATLRVDEKNILSITVKERHPEYLWCGRTYRGISTEKTVEASCYYLDKNGLVFLVAPEGSRESYLELYGPLGPLGPLKKGKEDNAPQAKEALIGRTFLTREKLEDLFSFIALLESTPFEAKRVTYDPSAGISIQTQKGFEIRYFLTQKVVRVIQNLKTAVQSPLYKEKIQISEEGKKEEKSPKLQYIDLRYGNRVFFK